MKFFQTTGASYFKFEWIKCFSESFVNRAQNLSKNFKMFWSFRPERVREIHLQSMDERLKEIWHSMSMALHTRKSILRSQSGLQFHVCFTIMVYNKIRHMSSQNEKATILQNTTNVYYKIRQAFYCKMWQFYSECKLLHSRQKDILKMPYEDTQDISTCLLDT